MNASSKIRSFPVVLAFAAIAAWLCWTLVGCSGATGVPQGFDEVTVTSKATEVIECCNANDYAGLMALCDSTMKELLTEETFEQSVWGLIQQRGDFSSIAQTVTTSSKDQNSGDDIATAVVVAEYTDGKIQYTISFNKAMELSGLYVK